MNETKIIEQLKQYDYAAFKEVCLVFVSPMNSLAYTIIRDSDQANKIVKEILCTLWIDNFGEPISLPIEDFLESQVKKACMKFMNTRPHEIKKRTSSPLKTIMRK